jgi:PEP-CTERM motif
MILKTAIAAAALAIGLVSSAGAQTYSTSTTGYSGADATTITFDSPLPNGFSLNGGSIIQGSVKNQNEQPLGSSGNYLTSGTGTARLSSATGYDSVNFLWGSMDSYNLAKFFDESGALIGQLTGSDVAQGPANGNTTSANTNRYVTYSVDPATNRRISSVELVSSSNSFEADNFSFYSANGPVPVPEPGTMMLFALGTAALLFLGQRRTSLFG